VKLLGYVRVSRVGGRSGESFQSPQQQRDIVEAYALAHGHDVQFLEPDLDESGKGLDRPAMRNALKLLEAGKADGIIAARLDRLTRRVSDLGRLLESAGVNEKTPRWNLIACDLGVDLATRNGRMVANLLATLAEWELDGRREGWANSNAFAIELGKYVGPTPAGYDRDDGKRLVPNEHADAVRGAFELRAKGESWKKVAAHLTDAGVPNRKGGPWSLKAAEKLLRNEAYLGVARWGDERNESAHEPIVGPALFRRVQKRFEKGAAGAARSLTREGSKTEPGLLSGILVCAGCGHRMTQDWTMRGGQRTTFYRCKNGGACAERASITHKIAEPYVEALALARMQASLPLYPEDNGGDPSATDSSAAEALLAEAESDVAVFLASAKPSMPGYAEALAVWQAKIDEALEALAVASEPETFRFTAKMYAEAESVEGRREVLSSLIDRIDVRKGRVPVEEKVSIAWRGEPIAEIHTADGGRVYTEDFSDGRIVVETG
jgi:DNA invertase Pin-like site-specific DNA recombinase